MDTEITAEHWLRAIRDCADDERTAFIEHFYTWARPVIRRAVTSLRLITRTDGAAGFDDLELLVSEALLRIVRDVVSRRTDPAVGNAFYHAVIYQARGDLRRLARPGNAEDPVAPITSAIRSIAANLDLDRPHAVRLSHRVTGETHYFGPFPDVVSAFGHAEKVETTLHDRDRRWRATVHPLLDPTGKVQDPREDLADPDPSEIEHRVEEIGQPDGTAARAGDQADSGDGALDDVEDVGDVDPDIAEPEDP